MKRILFIVFIVLSTPVLAEKITRTVKDGLKRPQKREQLEKWRQSLLAEAAKPETRHKKRVECLLLAAECSEAVNEAENVKLYLKKPYDTVVFFSSIRDIFTLVTMADSVGAQPNEKGKVDLSGRRRYREKLAPYRSNLLTGGKWYYQHGQTQKAYEYFDAYLNAAGHPIFAQDSLQEKDVQVPMTSYLAVFSAQKEGNINGVLKHAERAKRAGQRSDLVQEYVARAWENKGDTTRWLDALHEGIRSYANNQFFFTHLLNYYTRTSQWEEGLALADSMTQVADTVALFWYAKSLMLLKLHRDSEAISACDSCLALAPDHVNAYYNKGIAALNIATAFADTACTDLKNPQFRKDQATLRKLYQLARQPMEQVRKLTPDDQERWAPALYRIYLHLNMGKEFDEIDRILKKKKS